MMHGNGIASGRITLAAAAVASLLIAGCSSGPKTKAPDAVAVRIETHGESGGDPHRRAQHTPKRSPYAPAQEDLSKRGNYTRGGLYAPGVSDSAPLDGIPDVDLIPEPQVRDEPHSRYGNRSPYDVLGKHYQVLDSARGYDETGIASYYGNKFHGRRTSNLEVYDMYAFTAAHKTLPLPSYARVTNLANGKSVVVRVNDRGPFHEGRIIDLSYAAAVKLGVDRAGTARVEVQGLMADGSIAATNNANAKAVATAVIATPINAPSQIDRLVAKLPPPAMSGNVFQLATFAARENGERALASVIAAGIDNARLIEADVGGRRLWRLRMGPVDPAATEELATRLRGLGFGQPQRVHE